MEGKYTIRSIVCEASCHLVTRSHGHVVTWSHGHWVTWSLGHSVTGSLGHLATVFNNSMNWLTDHIMSYRYASQTNMRIFGLSLCLHSTISPTLQSVHRLLLQARQVLQIQLQQSKEGALHQVGGGVTLIHCLCLLSWHNLRKGTKCLDHCILSNFKKFKCGKLFRK